MNVLTRSAIFAMTIPALTILFSTSARAEEPACPYTESRSALCGRYHSEISPAEAFVNTVVKRGNWSNPSQQPVILDVRSLGEYKAGHPELAINAPWPYIQQTCDAQGRTVDGACKKSISQLAQNVDDFVNFVRTKVPNKDTPIYTLCRTGVRSVGAANLLTDAGYTNVRNVWEGFWGVKLTAPVTLADGRTGTKNVDLNHDGVVDDLDNNGWRNHQALPYDTRLLPNLIYQPMVTLYYQ
jgi:rhodanese-related sulfurtransferase